MTDTAFDGLTPKSIQGRPATIPENWWYER